MSARGTFIIIEGGEGSGKDTQIERLKERFAGRSDVVFTREPGGTRIGEQVRDVLMAHSTANIDPQTEMLLFLATRTQLIHEIIEPALARGMHVICNRFGLSTIAYQIYGRERLEHMDFLHRLNEFVIGNARPDMCILLDIAPAVGIERVMKRPGKVNRLDTEELAFHERVREGYLAHVHEFGTPVVIDADQSVDDVWQEVEKAMRTLIPERV